MDDESPVPYAGRAHLSAEASEEASNSPYGRLLSDLCAGRQSADHVFAQAEDDVGKCLAAYFAGVRSVVDGRTADGDPLCPPCGENATPEDSEEKEKDDE